MAKKKKLKKQVYYVLVIIILLIIGIIFGIHKYKEYKYHQTYEYKLLEHGYSEDEVNKLLDSLKIDEYYDYLLNNEVNKDIVKLTQEKYFIVNNFYKYIDYMNSHKRLDLSTIVKNINIHLDQDFYEDTYNTDITKDTEMLVNKYYLLSSDYVPDDLVSVSQKYAWGEPSSQRVRKVAYDAFLEMWEDAYQEGYYFMINSSFRSFQDQEIVYNNYKDLRGVKYADSIAARPGSSEHQTGLAIDIFSKDNSNKNSFKDTEEAKWLANNSYKYGFILRYPLDKVEDTGYQYEAWHFRYVGKDIAAYIYENNITYEEYYAYFIKK